MAQTLNIGNEDFSRKITCAELNGHVVLMPIAKTITHRGTKVNNHGLPTPIGKIATSTLTGSLTGSYLFAVSLHDKDYDSYGPPTCLITTGSQTNKKFRVKLRSLTYSNTRNLEYAVWRTLAGGNVMFLDGVTSVAASTYTTNNTDAYLSARDTLKVGTQAARALAAGTYAFVIKHGARIFGMGSANYYGKTNVSSLTATFAFATVGSYQVMARTGTSTAYTSAAFPRTALGNLAGWCEANQPDDFRSDNEVEISGPEPIRSAADCGTGQLAVFKDNETLLWTYRDDPDHNTGDGSLQNMNTGRGAVTFKSVINVDGQVFVMDRQGFYVYGGGNAVLDLTEEIRPVLERVNWQVVADIHGCYDDERIMWFLPLDGDTECRHCLYLDRQSYQANQGAYWWLANIPQGARDSSSYINGRDSLSLARGVAGKRIARIMTTYGLEYDIMPGMFSDGLHPALTQSGYTSTGSATFGGLNGVNGQFRYSSVQDARGCYVRFGHSRTPDPILISSATSTRFTLQNGVGFTMPKSTAYTIAAIHTQWKSGVLDFGGAHDKKVAFGMDMRFQPLGVNARMQLQFVADRMGPAIHLASTTQTGWRAGRGKDHVEVDMGGNVTSAGRSGFVEIPVPAKAFGQLQIVLQSSAVNCPWRVTDLEVIQKSRRTDR